MKVAAEFTRPEGRVSIFRMNNKYLIKIERGNFEQTFKISELDYVIKDEKDAERLLDEDFMKMVTENFMKMNSALHEALDRNGF